MILVFLTDREPTVGSGQPFPAVESCDIPTSCPLL